jgi:hypothetical protein
MSGSGDAFIYDTISNVIFDGQGEPVTLNGTFETEFDAAGSLVGVSNISLVASSSDPNTNPSTLDAGTINNVGIPAPYGGDTINEIYVTADGGSFNQAYLDFSGEEPTALIDQASYGHFSSIGWYNGTTGGLESIDAGGGGNDGTVTSTALPLSPVTLDNYVYTTLSNVVFDGDGVPVTLAGTFLTEYDPNGTLIGVSQVSLTASDPGAPGSYASFLDVGAISVVGTPGASGDAALNEISVTIDGNGGGSFQHANLDWVGEAPSTLATDTSAAHYSSIGYSTGTEALPGPDSSTGTNTDNVADTFLLATMSSVVFNGNASNQGDPGPATLSGTFEEEFNPGGTLVGVSNVDLSRVDSNGTIAITQLNDYAGLPTGFSSGSPEAGGYAAVNQIDFQSGAADSYGHTEFIDLLGEEPDAVFAGASNSDFSSDSGSNYQPINGYEGMGNAGTITYEQVAPCFAAGTRIATPTGETTVQSLAIGDEVRLATGGAGRIRWIGRRRVNLARHSRPDAVQPVRIAAGALADGVPARDLIVSPDHALFLDNLLVPAKALINGASITQLTRKTVTYYHIELATHGVLLAEGTPAESYLETGNRGAFENGGPAITLHPDFAQSAREAKGCAPFAQSGPAVEAIRARILARAGAATTHDAGVEIRFENGNAIIFSRHAIPAEVTPDPSDRRSLGVKIASLSVGGENIPLDHPALTQGWHDAEPDGRWTQGAALIPASLLNGGVDITVEIAATLPYRVAQAA